MPLNLRENEQLNECLRAMITGETPNIPYLLSNKSENPYDFLVEQQIAICIQDLEKIIEEGEGDFFEMGDFLYSQIFPYCSFSDSEIIMQKKLFFLRIAEVYNYFRTKKINFLERIDVLDEGESYAFSLDKDERVILFLFLKYRWIVGSLSLEFYSDFRHDAKIIQITCLKHFIKHQNQIQRFAKKIQTSFKKTHTTQKIYLERVIYALGEAHIKNERAHKYFRTHFFKKVLSQVFPDVFFFSKEDTRHGYYFYPKNKKDFPFHIHFIMAESEQDYWSVMMIPY